MLETWCDVLEPATDEEIRRAWACYQTEGPRSASGRLIRPDPGWLMRRIRTMRPRPRVVGADEGRPAPKPLSEEERDERIRILTETSENLKRMQAET